jgi:tetratricopeptide (TPR) repeat protein
MAFVVSGIVAPAPPGRLDVVPAQAATESQPLAESLKRVTADLFSGKPRIDDDIRELKRILALDARSAEAHFLLGIAYRLSGSPDLLGEAVAELRQALSLNSAFIPARFYLASVYLDLGRAARAREELEAALVQHPGQPQFLALLGEAERQLRNPGRSVELNRQALDAKESFAQARYYLGLALRDLKRVDEAIRELEQVVQSGPVAADGYVGLGAAYLDAGRTDSALKVLGRAVEIDPSRPDTRVQLARAYRMKGLLAEADKQLKLAMGSGNATISSLYQPLDADLYLEVGLVRQQQGRLEAAAEAFEKVLEADPAHELAGRRLTEVRRRIQDRLLKKKTGDGP